MLEVIPAILTSDAKELEEKIKTVEGLVRRVHIDIIDGIFANNKTVSLDAVSEIETELLIDIHLMTKEPTFWIEHAVRAMADRVIGQVEMMENQAVFLQKCQEAGLGVGLGIDLATNVDTLDATVLRDLDVVLVMGVAAGFGGQSFQEIALEKVKKLVEIRDNGSMNFRICVDGGVSKEVARAIREAGADEVAAGNAVYIGDIGENIKKLKEAR
jgi:ribulose-phosphate 3-epimerase